MRNAYQPGGAVLILIWTAYYYAMRQTGGRADARDRLVCGLVALLCVGVMIRWLVQRAREKR